MDVQLPDGTIARFPDDMPETQIRTALLKATQGRTPTAPVQSEQPINDAAHVGLGGLIEGIPIAGPVIRGGLDRAGAYARSLASGNSYGDELKFVQGRSDELKKEHPVLDTTAQIGGAIAGTLPMIAAAPGAMGVTGASLGARALAGGATGSAIGGADAAVRSGGDPTATAVGAGLGLAAGGAAPYVGQAVGSAARTISAPIIARLSPEGATRTALVRTMQRAGQTPDQITDALRAAQADGQGMFTVADALGHPGQRMLSTIARTPGDGERMAVVEALESRQAGQGRRVANSLSEAFDAPDTAAQRVTSLSEARRTAGSANYDAARSSAGAVDVSPAVAAIDDVLTPGAMRLANPGSGIANDSVEGALSRARSLLTDGRSNLSDFTSVLRAKQDIDDMIERATRAGSNNQARMLTTVRQRLDESLASASEPYSAARDAYRQGSRQIEAVDTGRSAATRGRSEDTTRTFAALSPEEQQAFRAGYADPLIEQAQGGAVGVNKARPLLNDATAVEFPAFAAPGRADQLGRRLGREQTMFETRNQALGGSRTADNLADQADLGMLDPSIVGNVISGNWGGALKSGALQAMQNLRGMPQPVRQRLATTLLQTDPSAAGRDLAQAIVRGDTLTERQMIAAQTLLRGAGIAGN